jgi:hypothetical protein
MLTTAFSTSWSRIKGDAVKELTLARRKVIKKNSGTGRSQLPFTRKYERQVIEQKPKHEGRSEVSIRQLEERIAEINRELGQRELKNDAARLSQAQELNRKAEAHMAEHGTAFVTAVRAVHQEEQKLSQDEPTVEQVERYARENEMDFSTALRSMLHDQRTEAQAFAGVRPSSGMSVEQEEAEIRRIAKERGYELDD